MQASQLGCVESCCVETWAPQKLVCWLPGPHCSAGDA